MAGYGILLLDVDNTLLDFIRSERSALETVFEKYGMVLTDELAKRYSAINDSYWKRFETGEIEKAQVLSGRFESFFAEMGRPYPGPEFAGAYQTALANTYFYLEDSDRLIREWAKGHRLYIVTNGVSATQRTKLALCGFDKVVDGVFISEETGYQKPKKEYFDYCLARIPNFRHEDAIIIGDSLTSDIRGGNQAGVATCWYNPDGLQNTEGVHVDHEIRSLAQVADIIG